MPWFKIDDKAHSHPKLIKAGNAALGLWLRCGSYAAQHLTEGIVPGVVAQLYGTAPQAKKLIAAGLWHEHGHNCDRCPQPPAGDYVVHDFLEDGRNTSRAKYEAEKKKARDRQAKHRESRTSGSESSAKTDRFEDESSSKKSESASENSRFSDSFAGQKGTSRRDENVTGIHAGAGAAPNPSTSYGSTGAAGEQRDGLPDPLAELKRGIAAAGLSGVAWDLRESGWEYTRQAVNRVGVPAMVAFAINSARLKGQPAGASAWVQGWRSLEAPEQQDGVAYLPAVVGGLGPANRNQQEVDDWANRAMQRAKSRMQQESS
ncbi:mucin-2 [Streptomyces sp. NPDC059176]|uniref:mucin-2 n=1 Tax=Streptomyces sp. NPDC059176 TaxID=3346758 RepID=UPI0036BC8DE0